MIQNILPSLIALLVALPIIYTFRKSNSSFLGVFLSITAYHLCYVIVLFIPLEFQLQITETSFNWTGKILAILFSIAFYLAMKKNLSGNDFINTSPYKKSIKKITLVGGITILAMCLLTFSFSQGKPLSLERLAYQLTMPGIDEELWRGILLGLLLMIVKDDKFKFGHPAIWGTTIIFALGHSLYFQNWDAGFAADVFIVTGVLGYILGWTILKSKSIWLAIILHNLINFSTNFVEMMM